MLSEIWGKSHAQGRIHSALGQNNIILIWFLPFFEKASNYIFILDISESTRRLNEDGSQ